MIRTANMSDAEQIIPLIMVILKDMELEFLTKYGEETTIEVLKKAFSEETFRYGYKRAIVVEEADEILGVAYGYKEEEEESIDLPLKPIFKEFGIPENEQMFTEKEALKNEWYLDTIAVRSDQRGKGIGAQLLTALPDFAKEQGASTIGLNVDEVNPRAKQLYIKQGFLDVGKTTISGHAYDHMQKKIN